MKIYLKNIVKDTITNKAGTELYDLLNKYIQEKQQIELSLKDATAISSSFFNTSFGAIIENYGFVVLKQYIKLTEADKFQASIMKLYIESAKKRSNIAS